MNKTVLSLLAFSALTHSASAENRVTLEPLTVSSTAIKTDELRSTDAVEVYTAEEIAKAHVQNVYEFLSRQTSVVTMPSYGNPFTQKLDMHGYGIGDGYQNIVVTVNGRRMNNIDMVPQLLSSISPASIDKIEIIKSSGIVTGGDGANAGVINITTKRSGDKELTLYGGTYINNDGIMGTVEGPYGTRDGSFYLGHSNDYMTLSATGEIQKNDGMRDVNPAGDKDKSSLRAGSFDLALTPIEALEFRLGASLSRTDIIYAGYLTQDEYESNPFQAGGGTANDQEYDTNVFSGGASYYVNSNFTINLDIARETKTSKYAPITSFYLYNSIADYTYDSEKLSLEYQDDIVSFITGIDLFNGERDSRSHYDNLAGYISDTASVTDKNNLAGFLMTEWYMGNSTIKAGYRYEKVTYKYKDLFSDLKDDHALNGAELGYNYTLNDEQSMFANYALSYQAPDIDRFFSYGSFNGFIEPMKAKSYTIGHNYILPENKLKLSVYYVELKNEIYYHPDPTYVNAKNTNIDRSHKFGVDLYDKWLISDAWNIALNYNYVEAVIDEEKESGDDYAGKQLPGVSKHNVKATLSYLPNPNTTFAVTEVYRSKAYAANDFNNDFSQRQDPYMSTDVSATYVREDYELFAKINNLFVQKNGLWIQDDAIYPVNYAVTGLVGLKLKL